MLINSRFVNLPPWAWLFFSRDIWTEAIGSRGVTVQSAKQPITWMCTKGELLPGAPLLLLILSATLLPHWVQFHLILSFTSGGILIKPAKRICGPSPAAMAGKFHQCPAICLFKTLRQRLITDLVRDKWGAMLLACAILLVVCFLQIKSKSSFPSVCRPATWLTVPTAASLSVLQYCQQMAPSSQVTHWLGGGRVIPVLKF